jgi:hypothetical protein
MESGTTPFLRWGTPCRHNIFMNHLRRFGVTKARSFPSSSCQHSPRPLHMNFQHIEQACPPFPSSFFAVDKRGECKGGPGKVQGRVLTGFMNPLHVLVACSLHQAISSQGHHDDISLVSWHGPLILHMPAYRCARHLELCSPLLWRLLAGDFID